MAVVVGDDAAEALDHQPRHPPNVLARDPRAGAGDDHSQRRDARQQVEHQRCHTRFELLAVVEHQQRRARQPPRDRGFRVNNRAAGYDGRRDRLRDELGVGGVAQIGPPGAGDEVLADRCGKRRREPGLARAARPDQR